MRTSRPRTRSTRRADRDGRRAREMEGLLLTLKSTDPKLPPRCRRSKSACGRGGTAACARGSSPSTAGICSRSRPTGIRGTPEANRRRAVTLAAGHLGGVHEKSCAKPRRSPRSAAWPVGRRSTTGAGGRRRSTAGSGAQPARPARPPASWCRARAGPFMYRRRGQDIRVVVLARAWITVEHRVPATATSS